MLYRRHPYTKKQPSHFDYNTVEEKSKPDINTYTANNSNDIPLPNEEEKPADNIKINQYARRSSLLGFFKDRIHIEEIILLGLIFVLLDEGIDDEFLLIILIYILLT